MSQPQNAPAVRDQIKQAIHAIESRAFVDADACLTGLERTAPSLALVHYLRAQFDLARGGDGVAASERGFRKALILDPANTTTLTGHARLPATVIGGKGALRRARRVVTLDPGKPSNHWALSMAAKSAGEREMALRAIRRSLCLEPDISGPSESLYRLEDSPRALLKLSMLATESSDAAAVVCASLWNRLSPGHAGTAEDPGIDDTTLRIAGSNTDLALAAFFYLADSGRVGQAWQVLAEAARKAPASKARTRSELYTVAAFGALYDLALDDAGSLFRTAAQTASGSRDVEGLERYAALSERAGAGPSELSARSGETDIPDMVWLRRPARTDATILISVTGDALDGLREILSANVWQTDRPPLHIHVIDPTSTKAPLAFADAFDAALTVENRANSPLKDLDPSGYASAIALCRADTLLEEKTYSRVIIANPALEWFPRLRQLLGARLPGDAAVMDHPWRSPKDRFDSDVLVFGAEPAARAWLGRAADYVADQIQKAVSVPAASEALFSAWLDLALQGTAPSFKTLLPLKGRLYRPAPVAQHPAQTGERFTDAADLLCGGPASVLNGLAGALMSDGRPSTVVDLLSRPANRENLSGDTQVLLAKASLEIGQWSAVEATLSDRSGESGPDSLRADARLGQFHAQVDRQYILSTPRSAKTVPAKPISHADIGTIGEAFLENSPLHQDPFTYRIADGLFTTERYEALLGACISADETSGRREAPLADLLDALTSEEMIDLVVRCLGAEDLREAVEAAGSTLIATAKYRSYRKGYSLGPHRDARRRFASLVAYVPEKADHPELGTTLYRPKTFPEDGDHGLHMAFEGFDEVALSPYAPNSGIMFLNFGNAYHGVAPIRDDIHRRTLLCTLYMVDKDQASSGDPAPDD